MNFTWQNGRQLAFINDNISYQYNDGSIRTQKTVNGVTTNYYLNGSTILSQVTGSDQMDFYYDDTGNLFGFSLNGASYYYVKNLQNDIIGILDSDGSQVVSYVYDSWGRLISTTGSLAETVGVQNPFRYRGYYYDVESEMYYLNSRYYDPEIGRFINSDNLEVTTSSQTLRDKNLYAYCNNDPINFEDSEGELGHIALGAIIGAVVSVATTTIDNIRNGASAKEWASSLVISAVSGAASGALSATGLGVVGQCVGNGIIGAATSVVEQVADGGLKSVSITKTAWDTSTSVISAYIGGKGARAGKQYDRMVNNIKSGKKTVKKAYSYYISQVKNDKNINKKIQKSWAKSTASSYIENKVQNLGATNTSAGSGYRTNKTWCYPGGYV